MLEALRRQTEALAAGGVREVAERRLKEIDAIAASGNVAQAAVAARQLERATALHAEHTVAQAAEEARKASVFGRDHLVLSQQAQQLLHAS